ncbi:LOW QUALITY PROTEIN: neuropeptides B/W receptor type 1 [Rhynchonycteris naso]
MSLCRRPDLVPFIGGPEKGLESFSVAARENGIDHTSTLAEIHNTLTSELGLSNSVSRPRAGLPQRVWSWLRPPSQPPPPPPPPPPQPLLAVAIPVVYAVVCAVGLEAIWPCLLYVLLQTPRKKNITSLFILNLAIADELFTFVLPINIADFLLRQWPFGELMCKLIVTTDQFNTFSNLCFLTVMSAYRYRVVLTTESRRVAGRTGVARSVSLPVWVLVTLVVLPFSIFALDEEKGRRQCVLVFPQPEAWCPSLLYKLVLAFAISVSTICDLYITLLCPLRAMRLGCAPCLDSHARVLDRAKKRVTLVVAILVECLLCWMHHLSTILVHRPPTSLVIAVSDFITSLSYTNSCFNPFLYAFLDDSCRRNLRLLLVCRTVS